MSAQTPSCQLLDRPAFAEDPDFAGFYAVAPPDDPWVWHAAGGVISADERLLSRSRAAGRPAVPPLGVQEEAVPAAVLFWPKALKLAGWWLDWLNRSLPDSTPLAVVGEHGGGVRRAAKMLAERGMAWEKRDSARRCSVFVSETQKSAAPAEEAAWQTFGIGEVTLASHPGVFGHGKVDEGTALLLDTLESELGGASLSVLDVGCGDGIISAWLARRGHDVTAVDVSHFAVEATRRTLAQNGLEGRVLASDVYAGLEEGERFDAIVSNPPFHQERNIDYGPAGRLIGQAAERLNRGGQLVLVANAFLPYAGPLERALGKFETLADNRRFKVYRARKA
ncbi:methyltransferase [Halomonas piscis]|uniref:Methyltransferase n=1 Tax=Halomonas piscis TaxID=3031727 RepID=A0ABY9Z2L7_9GAMM|nr:methyltransferase [Halomonas piscis]WNK21277.1 methyltransferase [Halomonas piscis]